MSPEERIQEIQGFLAFATTVWPVQRGRVSNLASRCQKCVLSERHSPLVGGLCGPCREGEAAPSRSENERETRELDGVLKAHAGKGAEYDALVLFSGGKDSCYLVHRLKKDYPRLRLLGLTIDNGFMSTVALANANRLAARLNLDLLIFKPRASLFEKTFRHALTHVGKGGCYETVDRMDGDLLFDIGRSFAARTRIPLVLGGLSAEQVERILALKGFESPRPQERQPRRQSAGFDLSRLYDSEERRLFWWKGARRAPRVLFPYHAWDLDESFLFSEVARLGLIGAGHDNPLVTNSDLIPVMLAVDSARLGYCSFEPEFARMVRRGKADRQTWLLIFEALEFLCREGRFLPNCLDDTLSRLGLSRAELDLPERASPDSREAA